MLQHNKFSFDCMTNKNKKILPSTHIVSKKIGKSREGTSNYISKHIKEGHDDDDGWKSYLQEIFNLILWVEFPVFFFLLFISIDSKIFS